MKNKILLYILSFLGFFAFSCNDDVFIDKSGTDSGESDGLSLSLKIDVPESRTRAIDMTPGGALYLNNIWIGVYNKNGQRVVSDSVNLHSRLTESGVTLTDVIKISTTGITDNSDYCIVGVANYYGIRTTNQTNTDLIKALEAASNWRDFADISIDTQQEFPNQTPVLMGYLVSKDESNESKHMVINQFDGTNNINFYNSSEPIVKGNVLKGSNSSNYVMKLRRLRSKININLITRDAQMTITNLEYKVVNVPKSSFLAERRTNTFDDSSKTGSAYSPNSADAKNEGYITLEDLKNLDNEGWQKPTDNYSFSYEHVENKHWATSGLSGVNADNFTDKYHERGDQSGGVFTHLAISATDWNNNASYVILRISLRDFTDGRNSTIEYTILEGFCNDANGASQVDANGDTSGSMETRLKDFSCFRNTDYNYNILINSVEDIRLTVTDNGSHPNDQHNGNIWQMKYPEFISANSNLVKDSRITVSDESATLTFESPIDCTIDEDNHTIDFGNIGFRLAGSFYDEKREEKIPVDLCYNVAHGELDGFSGLWIDPVNGVTEYFVDTTNKDSQDDSTGTSAYDAMEKYFQESHSDVETMLSRFTVNADGNNNTNLKITEFIKKLQSEDVTKITGVNVKGIRLYETAEESDGPRNHMIGLYIFDRQRSIEKGDRVKTDENGDCHYYQIRAIEQYPAYLSKVTYERIYAKYNNANRIPYTGGTTQFINNEHNEDYMIFSENPDIAFRLVGYYDKNGTGEYEGYYDICYNFDLNEYPYFNEFMPAATYDTRTISKTGLSRENIPTDLLNGIQIQEVGNGQPYSIKQFITNALAGKISSATDYRFVFSAYNKPYYTNNETERNNSIRALYIFDKKDRYKQPVLYNESANSATYQIYAAEQDGKYEPPVKLPNPSGNITYNQTATYNIIEENLGEITVPLLSGYTYNQDYYYRLYTKDDNGGSIRECKLENIKSQSNGSAKFDVPMSIAHANARNIYIQSKTLSDRLLDSDESGVIARTETLTNPEWDFTIDDWFNIYNTWSTNPPSGNGNSSFRYFFGKEETFGSLNSNILPITLSATGTNQIRGSIVENDRYLYINNSGCKVLIKIYRSCKVTLDAGYSSYDGRGMIVATESSSDTVWYDTSRRDSNNLYATKKLDCENVDGENLSFTITGNGSNIYKIRLTD